MGGPHVACHHFSTIGQTLADSLPRSSNDKPKINKPKTSLSEIPEVTQEEVLDMLKKYPNHKPTGITGISTRLIKMATPAIASILAQMINKCISTTDIPESWKSATVTPIHKGGDRKDRHNYRPISVLPFIAKFLEAVINKQLQYHLIDNEIIHRSQAGFVPKRTTSSMLINLTDECLTNLDNGQETICVFLDIKKAFDSVSHSLLLQKLKYIGVTGTAHNLLTNYLKGRQQKTTINNAISDIHPITYGVPQGSILGPTLFVIYINDLPSVITHSKIFMYADDTALTVSRKETKAASILIQRDLNKVNQWMCSNKLNLNAKKSQYLVTSTPYKTKSNFSLSISAVALKRTEAYKYLGITIDEHLKFNLHINNIS